MARTVRDRARSRRQLVDREHLDAWHARAVAVAGTKRHDALDPAFCVVLSDRRVDGTTESADTPWMERAKIRLADEVMNSIARLRARLQDIENEFKNPVDPGRLVTAGIQLQRAEEALDRAPPDLSLGSVSSERAGLSPPRGRF
jgi:hypothetical protein